MKEAGNPITAPQVHLYKNKEVEEVDASHLLLITDKKGNKYNINVNFILELVEEVKELKVQVNKLEKSKQKEITKKEVINALTENGIISFTKPVSLFGNKVNEKRIKAIGTTYGNKNELRFLTSEGWKSIQLK